ncbi:MAG: transglutaminase domain-containing protein [Nanoarchaeota archaeon]
MKKLAILLISLIVIPSVIADWFYNSQSIITNIDISSYAEAVPTTPSGYIDTVTINLTFFPKQTNAQELLKFYTDPLAEVLGDTLKFTWNRPETKIDFRINAEVKTHNLLTEIKRKINFPIQDLPKEVVAYTRPSETIDSDNEEITRIGSELAKGEDDLYIVVFKIADWTKNNIEYNLSTLTSEVSQKASWVLQNKQGVCDELTSLFIALLRAIGIPARFVSGLAYTESSLFPEKWGAHGWAEVYFPNYGWVPFDVTYGQFGWIDPTHIKFKESMDSDEPSTYYNWLGRNTDLKTRKLEIKAELMDKIGEYKVPLNIEASTLKKAIGFGSYNLLTATIENPNDFYYATELFLSRPKEVKIIGNELKNILLLPKEKKKLFWILKLDDNLDSRYTYTFPLSASTLNKISSEASFTSSIREKSVSFEEVKKIAELLEEEKEKRYSGNVDLDCKVPKSEFYEYENLSVYCNAKNTGNVFLEDAEICFEGTCRKVSIGISQTKNATFEINYSAIGFRESQVTLKNELVSKRSQITFTVNDAPKIEIEKVEFPGNVSYGDTFNIIFTLAKKSISNPIKVEITFAKNGIEKVWHINEMAENKKFILNLEANQLNHGKNDYKANVDYFDALNRKYNSNKEFSINLTNVTLWQRFFLWINGVESITLQIVAITTLVIGIVFAGLIIWIRRKSKD